MPGRFAFTTRKSFTRSSLPARWSATIAAYSFDCSSFAASGTRGDQLHRRLTREQALETLGEALARIDHEERARGAR